MPPKDILHKEEDWERSVFIPVPKKGNAKECSNYHTIALMSHTSKVMLKSSKPGFNSTWTMNFQMFKLNLEKAEEPEIKLLTSAGSSKKQESARKMSTSALLTMPKPLTVWITNKLWKTLKKMGIPDQSTCLLRSPYVSQEATVRTGYVTTDWFKIGKKYNKAVYCHPAFFWLICRVHHKKYQAGWITTWTQDWWEKY